MTQMARMRKAWDSLTLLQVTITPLPFLVAGSRSYALYLCLLYHCALCIRPRQHVHTTPPPYSLSPDFAVQSRIRPIAVQLCLLPTNICIHMTSPAGAKHLVVCLVFTHHPALR